MPSYDLVVIGAGPGGYVCALRAATLGMRVAVVEKEDLGGVCLNRGCIPTKALIRSARLFRDVNDGKLGVRCEKAEAEADTRAMLERARSTADVLRKGIEALFKRRKVELIRGRGRLAGGLRVEIEGAETLHAGSVVIATGSRPFRPLGVEPDGRRVLTTRQLLEAEEIPPGEAAVVGAGAVGVEFACLLASLGRKVTLVEMTDRVLPEFIPDCGEELGRALKKMRVKLELGARVESCEVSERIRLHTGGGEAIAADWALVALGRRPNTEELGLEDAGVELTGKGFVGTDERCETSRGRVYAVGDVTGTPMLAHKASAQGLVAAGAAAGEKATFEERLVPSCVYSYPQVASVGLDEGEGRAASKFPARALGRSHTHGEVSGFFKLVYDPSTRQLLGAHIVCEEASELIPEAALAVSLEARLDDLARLIHPHPTMSEGLSEAAHAALGKAIHIV